MSRRSSLLALSAVVALAACDETKPAPVASSSAPLTSASSAASAAPKAPDLKAVPRLDFNRIAAELFLPLFWIDDADKSGAIEPSELAVLHGIGAEGADAWIKDGAFTKRFFEAYAQIADYKAKGPKEDGLSDAEKKRRAAVRAELTQGRPSVVITDLRKASDEERALVDHIIKVSRLIEKIFAKQKGSFGLDAKIPAGDTASRALFHRNQGPFCEQPKTEKDPDCNALTPKPERLTGVYPASAQKEAKFCEKIEADKNKKDILGPFSVVVEEGGELKAQAYNVAYKEEMDAVARELDAAAADVKSEGEGPLKAYLTAAAASFRSNDWQPADEAWAKMNVSNSKWYLRVGPDETYFEPCSHKGGFHVSFARINQDSLTWQKMLDPKKTEMEELLAKLAGDPYKARKVTFHLPDFIDIVLNAGDSRQSVGATVGQSLPNWGPVANEGRGRTVAMTNLYTDKDNLAAFHDGASSLLCKGAMALVSLDPKVLTMSTVLHEAAHNLGPAHEYKVGGKKDRDVFGGPLASMLEELKAQTSALYLVDWMAKSGMIEKDMATKSHVRDILWAFGHIAQGMYGGDGVAKPYSQLAAIQVGALRDAGALVWKEGEAAANGADKGCVDFAMDKMEAAIVDLEKKVLAIKAKGDKPAALKLREAYVDDKGDPSKLRAVITERWLRAPKASFVYAILK